MWKYEHVWITLLFAICTSNTMGIRMRNREKIYIDVLKNITHVNNVLQDLLDNYKKLKSDYEARAAPLNELSAETVSDDEDRGTASKYLKIEKKKRYRQIKSDRLEDIEPVTQMILFEEELKKESSDKSAEDSFHKDQDKSTDQTEADSSDTDTPDQTAIPILRAGHGKLENIEIHRNRSNTSRHKTLLVFITSQNNEENKMSAKNRQSTGETEEAVEEINKFKAQILRDAYGTACLKVAVYRCYKALLEVRKIVCSSDFRCKGPFKDKYKKNSNAGCRKEFNIPDMKDPEGNGNDGFSGFRNYKRKIRGLNDGFDDFTRTSNNGKYYDLCLPIMISDFTNKSKKLNPNRDFKIQPIDGLRNRYENECRRMSKERCVNACHYATKETCEEHSCPKRTKRQFDKTCGKQCRYAFLSNSHSHSDTDSEGDSDDDSDESGESDSGFES